MRETAENSHFGIHVRLSRAAAAIVCALTALSTSPPAAAWQVRLRNDLSPGALAVYSMTIQGVRHSRSSRYDQALTYEQSGRLTLLVAQRGERGVSHRIWMMELDAARIEQLTRDDQPVEELPDARVSGLPPRAVQLRVSRINSETAPAFAAGGSRVQRAAMILSLDFFRWPDRLIRPGDTWESEPLRSELAGTWVHTYDNAEGRGSDRVAVGSFSFDGKLAGPLEGAAVIERAQGTWTWRVAKRTLVSATSEVILAYNLRDDPRRLRLRIELKLDRHDRLSPDKLRQATEQVRRISSIAGGDGDPSPEKLSAFLTEHSDSLWAPVARHLAERVKFDERVLSGIERDQMIELLGRLVTRWQQSALANKTEPLQPIRATFRELLENNRSVVYSLTEDDDRNVRAMATFCIAFGDDSSHLGKVIEMCDDPEGRVRAWAAYGLAERRDTDTPADVLHELLVDEDRIVRYRAAMAIRTCIQPESEQRDVTMPKLMRRLDSEPDVQAREQVALAVSHLATSDDLSALIDAEGDQEMPPVRRILEAAIRRLGGKPRGLDEREY